MQAQALKKNQSVLIEFLLSHCSKDSNYQNLKARECDLTCMLVYVCV